MFEIRRAHATDCRWIFVSLLTLATIASAAPPRSPHKEMTRPCTDCHTTRDWHEIHFDHAQTGRELQGSHVRVTCTTCHRMDDFGAADGACLSCHVDGHQGALESDCARCHEPRDWRPTGFDHEMTTFPLWGAHGATDCVQCHVNEVTWQFALPPETCFDCHGYDFRRAPVSVHLTAGPDCESCHTLDRWQGGHDPMWMEIRGGRHEVACDLCHKQAADYTSYTCADCHEFSRRIDEHVGIDVNDARCLECHVNGFDDDD